MSKTRSGEPGFHTGRWQYTEFRVGYRTPSERILQVYVDPETLHYWAYYPGWHVTSKLRQVLEGTRTLIDADRELPSDMTAEHRAVFTGEVKGRSYSYPAGKYFDGKVYTARTVADLKQQIEGVIVQGQDLVWEPIIRINLQAPVRGLGIVLLARLERATAPHDDDGGKDRVYERAWGDTSEGTHGRRREDDIPYDPQLWAALESLEELFETRAEELASTLKEDGIHAYVEHAARVLAGYDPDLDRKRKPPPRRGKGE